MNKTERLDYHEYEIFKINKRLGMLEKLSDLMTGRLRDLFKWLGIRKIIFTYFSDRPPDDIYPDPCLQQQIDAICDHLKIDVKTIQPTGKKVVAKKRHHPKKKKSPSKKQDK